jgi:hypothetical protein
MEEIWTNIMQDTGYQIPDAGYQMPDTRCQIPDAGYQMPDTRCRMPDTRYRIQVAGYKVVVKIS